jgi:signal transduction histidine kinase
LSTLVRLRRNREGVVISVEDRGHGIASEDMPFLFDRFYQAARARASSQASALACTS